MLITMLIPNKTQHTGTRSALIYLDLIKSLQISRPPISVENKEILVYLQLLMMMTTYETLKKCSTFHGNPQYAEVCINILRGSSELKINITWKLSSQWLIFTLICFPLHLDHCTNPGITFHLPPL